LILQLLNLSQIPDAPLFHHLTDTAKWASRLQSPDFDVTVAPELSANAGEIGKRFRVLKVGAAGSAMSYAPNRVVKHNQSYA
jgi:hypothetical protein